MTTQLSRPIHSTLVGSDQAAADGPRGRIVFLHGLFGRGKNFATVAQALAPEAVSLLVDLPNHGESGWTERFSYEEMADAVADHLRGGFAASEPVDVVGHSMGGKLAMVLALRHPGLVRRLVVVDISPTAGVASRSEFPHLLDSLASLDLAALSTRGAANAALQPRIPSDAVRGFLLQNLQRGEHGFAWQPNLALLRSELDAVMGFPDVEGRQFDGPVLWMGGEHSGYITDDDEPAMRRLFPRTRRMTVRGVGHWVHSEAPQVFVDALRSFLCASHETDPDERSSSHE